MRCSFVPDTGDVVLIYHYWENDDYTLKLERCSGIDGRLLSTLDLSGWGRPPPIGEISVTSDGKLLSAYYSLFDWDDLGASVYVIRGWDFHIGVPSFVHEIPLEGSLIRYAEFASNCSRLLTVREQRLDLWSTETGGSRGGFRRGRRATLVWFTVVKG